MILWAIHDGQPAHSSAAQLPILLDSRLLSLFGQTPLRFPVAVWVRRCLQRVVEQKGSVAASPCIRRAPSANKLPVFTG
jgi:hypothetical protein